MPVAAGELQTVFPLSSLHLLPPRFAECSCQKLLPGVAVLASWSLAVMPVQEGGKVHACAGAGEVNREALCMSAGVGDGRGGHGQRRLFLR